MNGAVWGCPSSIVYISHSATYVWFPWPDRTRATQDIRISQVIGRCDIAPSQEQVEFNDRNNKNEQKNKRSSHIWTVTMSVASSWGAHHNVPRRKRKYAVIKLIRIRYTNAPTAPVYELIWDCLLVDSGNDVPGISSQTIKIIIS